MYGHQGGKGGAMNWEIGIDIYTLLILCIRQITHENLLYSSGNSVLCGDLNGKEKRGDLCIHIADSLCSTVATSTTW